MKKFIFPLIAVLLLGVTTSCDDYYIFQKHEYKVEASDWVTQDGLDYYFVPIDIDGITSSVEKYGMVEAYVYNKGCWNPLPYVYPYINEAGETISENLRYEWKTGKVNLIVQDLNGQMPEDMRDFPEMTFKICING